MVYKAFISYSHKADEKLAAALQTALQQFAKPYYALRAFNVFRDQTDLSADPSLWTRIEEALDSSEFFLLVASPESAKSYWVKREIDHWLRAHDGKPTHILLLVTRGSIEWDVLRREFDWNKTDALPQVLDWDSNNATHTSMSGLFREQPFYVDCRWADGKTELSMRDAEFSDRVGTIAAELHGQPKSTLVGRDVLEHKRFRRLRMGGIVALAIMAIAATILGIDALLNARRATAEFEVARSQGLAAESYRYRDSDPQLAALLAVGANDIKPTVESLGAMLRMVYERPRPQFIETPVTTAFAVSPSQTVFATGHADGTIQLRAISGGTSISLRGSSWKVSHLAFDATGSYLAVSHEAPLLSYQSGDLLEVWNIQQKTPIRNPIQVLGSVSWIAFVNKGNAVVTLASTLGQSLLRNWDLKTGQMSSGPTSVRGKIAALSPDGKTIGVVVSGESTLAERIVYLDAQSLVISQFESVFDDGASEATAATFDLNGDWFITGHAKGEIRFSAFPGTTRGHVQASPREPLKPNLLTGHTGAVTSLSVHPGGKVLASGSDDGTIRLWHLLARRPLVPPDKAEYGTGTGFDPYTGAMVDSTEITSPAPHGQPLLRSFEPKETVYQWDRREMSLGFSSDGKHILEASSIDAVQCWEVPFAEPVINYRRNPGQAAATDNGALFAKTDGFNVDVESADGSVVSKASLGEYVNQVMLDQSGTIVAAAGALSVRVFDARSGVPVSPTLSSGSVQDLSPDGTWLSVGGSDEIVRFLNARSGTVVGKVGTGIPGAPSAMAFTSDSRHLFVGTRGGAIHEVEVPSGKDVGRFQQGGQSVSVITVDHGGNWLAVADSDNNIRIWDVHTKNRVGPVISGGKTDGVVLTLRFSHDGSTLAIGAEKLQVRLIDVKSGQQIGPDFNTLQAAEGVSFTPNDEEVRVFARDLPPRTLVLSATRLRPVVAGIAGRNSKWSEWERFFSPEPYRRIFPKYSIHESYLQEAHQRVLDGRQDNALAMFQRAAQLEPDLHLDPKNMVAQVQLIAHGEDQARLGDTVNALADFNHAQALGWHTPKDIRRYAAELASESLTAKGVRFAEINDIDQAIGLFSKALEFIKQYPISADGSDGRIQRELLAAGATQYAKQVALQTLTREAEDLASIGQVEEAADKLRAAGQYNPAYAADPTTQARAMAISKLTKQAGESVARNDLERAKDLYARIHTIDPTINASQEFNQELAGVKRGQVKDQAEVGQLTSALKLIDEAQELDPQPQEQVLKAKIAATSIADEAKGDQLAEQGQQQAAIEAYRAALIQNPLLKLDPVTEARNRRIGALRSQAGELLSKGDRAGVLKLARYLAEVDEGMSLDRELIVLTCPSSEAQDDLRTYLTKGKEKVFLFTPLGSWQWTAGYNTQKEAYSAAIKDARSRYGGREAFVYMKNDLVVAPNQELKSLREIVRGSRN